MLALKRGEHVIFVGEPGRTIQSLMASIGSCFRGGESMGSQGFTQLGGLTIFEGEMARPCVKVIRVGEPK